MQQRSKKIPIIIIIVCILIVVLSIYLEGNKKAENIGPDLIVFNADIRTSDPKSPIAQAFAVKKGKFIAIGTNQEIQSLGKENTQQIDAQGLSVLPGFIDSHTHLSSGGKIVSGVNLTGIKEKSVWLDMIAERVKTMEPGEWLLGGRWDYTLENKGLPNRWELDEVSPNNPVALSDIDGHSMWVNTLAIDKANITADSVVPVGGQIMLDEDTGKPNGILLEGAMDLVWREKTYVRDSDEARKQISQVLNFATSLGITSVHDMSSKIELEKYLGLAEEGKLYVRTFYGEHSKFDAGQDSTSDKAQIEKLRNKYKFNDPNKGPMVEFGFIKYVMDGVLSTHTAAMLEPYSDRPDLFGEPFYTQEEIDALVKRANGLGFPVAIHAIGDRAVRMALNAFESSGNREYANRIEHIEIIDPNDVPRFKELNVAASMQPNHGTGVIGKYITERVGEEREKNAYVWGDFLRSRTQLGFSSDFATSPFSPLVHIADAVFRESPSGLFDGTWYPDQAVTFEQALFAYTQAGATLSGWGDELGSITVGKWADFVLLDRTLGNPVGRELKQANVSATYFAGRLVFSATEKN
ncbi:uncharacterized protein METZ01_LOCUS26572 [marine metagenome]|uniref:Amidohydrolase 3 domain-containing protein n=1 Tax=marine metagenome TaxID=408172 RepID=A0A381Q477_9ZZZZ